MTALDKIVLSGIECYAYGGVSDAEKEIGQRYRVDLQLFVDTSTAARTDDIVDAVHYGRVHDTVVSCLRKARFNLLETAADRVAQSMLQGFPVRRVTVRLSKLLPPIDGVVEAAAVEISRRRVD